MMIAEALGKLAATLETTAGPVPGTAVSLNTALLDSAQSGLKLPANFDDTLRSGFDLPASATALSITFSKNDVGTVANDQFAVTNAKMVFLNASLEQSNVTIIFSVVKASQALIVQIRTALTNWTLNDKYPLMTGYPFDEVKLKNLLFVFSTDVCSYTTACNTKIPVAIGQNLVAPLDIPDIFKPILTLAENVAGVGQPVIMGGPIELAPATGPKLYPNLDLKGVISDKSFGIFYLKAQDPFIGLRIETIVLDDSDNDDDTDNSDASDRPTYTQTTSIYFGAEFAIQNDAGTTIDLALEASIFKNGSLTTFVLYPDQHSWNPDPGKAVDTLPVPIVSAATVIKILANDNSYFSIVPASLQQAVASVGFKKLALTAAVKPPALASVSLLLGSNGNKISLFDDPTNGQSFAIEEFDLSWTMLSPLDSKARRNLALFTAEFVLFPSLFKKKNGEEGGPFNVSIDQDLNVQGSFDGKVSFNDALTTISKGEIQLPSGVSAEFSDVFFSLSPQSRTYSFGFTLDPAIVFISYTNSAGGKTPLIQLQDMHFGLTAIAPAKAKIGGSGEHIVAGKTAPTVYQGSISGVMGIGPVIANVNIDYDQTTKPSVWTLKASVAEPLSLSDLVGQLFRAFDLPDFLPGDRIVVEKLEIDATIPGTKPVQPGAAVEADDATSSYLVSAKILWKTEKIPAFGDLVQGIEADIGLQYDPSSGNAFSGSVIGSTMVNAFGASEMVRVGYSFGKSADDHAALTEAGAHAEAALAIADGPDKDSTILWVEWEGLRAAYRRAENTVTFTLQGWTVGKLIQSLMKTLDDPYFSLDAPWDFLNEISLDGLSVKLDLTDKTVTAEYTLPEPIDVVFVRVKGLQLRRGGGDGAGQKVTLMLDADIRASMKDMPLFKPGGHDLKKPMPAPPGKGSKAFELDLLAMGQRVAIHNPPDGFDSTMAVITSLAKIPATGGSSNPLSPAAQVAGQPYYDQSSGWLVATHFTVLDKTVDFMLVFNDPHLYGMRLALGGPKAKALAGLVIDVLYKKISDDVGVYQINFSFPAAIRNLDFGAYSITLPEIGIQIYTNGDFLIDFGFPYHQDFSRSFTVQAIVMGIPVIGSAGFYFGKVPASTVKSIPETSLGLFDPVMVFGFGARIGVGKEINKGILKAGLSLTVFGIIEGVFAAWHAYDEANQGDGSLVDDYFFRLQGTFGIVGKLYGEINFAIISANVNVEIKLQAQIVFESHKAIPLSATASVDVRVSVHIDLGLLSVTIHLSFSASIHVELTLGHDTKAPWELPGKGRSPLPTAAPALDSPGYAVPVTLRFKPLVAAPSPPVIAALATHIEPLVAAATENKPTLTIYPAPQFSVTAPDGATNLAQQRGAMIFLLTMSAPNVNTKATGGTDFEKLCAKLLPWTIDSLVNTDGNDMDMAATLVTNVAKCQLEAILASLSQTSPTGAQSRPIDADSILAFLKSAFTVKVAVPTEQDHPEPGAAIFPAFSGFSLKVPDPSGTGNQTIELENYVTITDAYRDTISATFAKLAAAVEKETQNGSSPPPIAAIAETPEPFATFIFEDYFLLIARQLVQFAIDGMNDFDYKLGVNGHDDSVGSILGWAREFSLASPCCDPPNDAGKFCNNDMLKPLDVVKPNAKHRLNKDRTLQLPGLTYSIQQSDTITKIATRYGIDSPSALILGNSTFSPMIRTGATVAMSGGAPQYVTRPGDSWVKIAAGLSHAKGSTVTLEELADDTDVQNLADLLVPATTIKLPTIQYSTGDTDTLEKISKHFDIDLQTMFDPIPVGLDKPTPNPNLDVVDLFSTDGTSSISISGLNVLPVSELSADMSRREKLGQLAGMTSRYLLHGMRLPDDVGLELGPVFTALYPEVQGGYGMYQLVGQQFPTPTFTEKPSYSMELLKSSELSWIEFPAATPFTVDLSTQAEQLRQVLLYATEHGYRPEITLDLQDGARHQSKHYALRTPTFWSTSAETELATITAPVTPGNAGQGAAGAAPQVSPLLWSLPETLRQQLELRQQALTAGLGQPGTTTALKDVLAYLPVDQPQIATIDPATRHTSFSAMTDYAFATRIDIEVKKLDQAGTPVEQRPDANDVIPTGSATGNSGTAAKPLAPFDYELIGPSPAEASLLERILTALDADHGVGDTMITGLFFLYEDKNNPDSGLNSQGTSEFVSFITQTNLSTETNPAMAPGPIAMAGVAPEPPRGILNEPSEIIKLIWELSTVRSGGYYLHYEQIESGQGLPDSLFDSTGHANLTLVITYGRAAPLDGHLTNFVNAMLTTQSIDRSRSVVTLESQAAPVDNAPMAQDGTIFGTAALFGIGVDTIARLNPTAQLTDGAEIPIRGVYHLITPADMGGQGPLAAIAERYSVGVTPPVTPEDLIQYNPHVDPQPSVVIRIPNLMYTVSSEANGPGNTIASLEAYYRLPGSALAYAAGNVQHPFAQKTLTVDSQSFEVQPLLGTANVGVDLLRSDPGTPVFPKKLPAGATPSNSPTLATYSEQMLHSLYQLLSAGFAENAFFHASPAGLPFGPKRTLTPEEAQAHRLPDSRRAAFATAPAEPQLPYEQTLGVNFYSKVNADSIDGDVASVLTQTESAATEKLQRAGFAVRIDRVVNAAVGANLAYAQNPAGGTSAAIGSTVTIKVATTGAPSTTWVAADTPPTNPYVGVGSIAQVNMQWLDLFGNRTITPFDDPAAFTSKPYTGPYNDSPVPVLYVDGLIGLSQWPNVRAEYTYTGTAAAPTLHINFVLDTAPYNVVDSEATTESRTPGEKTAAQDCVIFQRVDFQLNQVYSADLIPGISGNAVSMSLSDSLLATPTIALDDATEASRIRDFVAACLTYVTNRKAGNPGGNRPTLPLSIDLSTHPISDDDIIELDLAFTLQRQADLCDPLLRGIRNGLSATTRIRPVSNVPKKSDTQAAKATMPVSLMTFATDVEKVFATASWHFRVGVGAKDPARPKDSNSYAVWAARIAAAGSKVGLDFNLANTPLFYAPKPVAQALISDGVNLKTYKTGTGLSPSATDSLTFAGVDLNVWARQALGAIDTFLGASYLSPAFLVDQLTNDPATLPLILKSKESLAETISHTIELILENPAASPTAATHEAARKKYHQALLKVLGSAYSVNAAVVVPVTGATQRQPLKPNVVSQPRFYGQPSVVVPVDSDDADTADPLRNFSLSTAKIAMVASADGDTELAFLFTSKNVTGRTHVELPLTFVATHLEHDIRHVPGITKGYEQSSWINFVTGAERAAKRDYDILTQPIGTGTTDIPVVLRTLPTPPTATDQTAKKLPENDQVPLPPGTTPAHLAKWNYAFEFLLNQRTSQDSTHITVEFNRPLDDSIQSPGVDDPAFDLFASLAQVITVLPAIQNDFEHFLTKVTAKSKADDTDVINARLAVQSFSTIVNDFACAYKRWAKLVAEPTAASAPTHVIYPFEIRLSDNNGNARVDVLPVKGAPKPAQLPDPLIEVDPSKYTVEVAEPTTPGALVSYQYMQADGDLLPYEAAVHVAQRRISFSKLNLFGVQTAWSNIQVIRNEFLVPKVPTNSVFKFRTPAVAFANPVTPLLTYAKFDLDPSPTTFTMLDYLKAFFESLLSEAGGMEVDIKIESTYSYRVTPAINELPRTVLPISLLAPTAASTPPLTFLGDVADSVSTWFSAQRPTLNTSSQIVFQLDVSSGSGAGATYKKPLLVIRSLYIDANDVTDL